MLQELSIKNFAIIDDLKISFSKGLTILSGETGAGKSIIINAVNLILGGRASSGLIRSGESTAELEALFKISSKSPVGKAMGKNGYDPKEGLLIRRVIARNNRHRIYLNGKMATAGILHSITENLASISGQHAHQGLLKEEQHLLILDQFGGLIPLRNRIYSCYHRIIPLINDLNDLKKLKNQRDERTQLLKFQQKEIMSASVTPEEDILLDRERMRIKNSEALFQAVHKSIDELYNAPGAVIERLLSAKKEIERAASIDSELIVKAENTGQAAFQVEDIVQELQNYLKKIRIDSNRLETIEDRIHTLNGLKRKYGGSLQAVSAHLESIEQELSQIESISDRINEIKNKLAGLHEKLIGLVTDLSIKRKHVAKTLSKKVEKELATLKMTGTRFKVLFEICEENPDKNPYLSTQGSIIGETGMDRITFLIAPNVGEPLKPLAGIVSGGELSRIVLALKAILAKTEFVETIVFDEVDAGIGGSVAEVVGKKLAALAAHHQIICITHLAQIAKFGDHHFSIAKNISNGRTKTTIQFLNHKDRVREIARMLGGAKITGATLEHAREILRPE